MINISKIKSQKLNLQRGFSLFIAMIVAAVLLIIAVAVTDIATKETIFSSFGRESQYAIFAADAGIECALYWDSKYPTSGNNPTGSAFNSTAPSGPISCGGSNIVNGSGITGTSTTNVLGGGGIVGQSTEIVWVEDSVPSAPNVGSNGGDGWTNWVSSNPTPNSGSLALKATTNTGMQQHYFYGASLNGGSITTGESLFAWVYVDPSETTPPTQIMLQWYSNAQGWNHRAYWGVDFLCSPMMWGCGGESPANHYMGVLPGTGWQKLVVPASSVGLEGQTVNGVAFSLYGGRATWDSAGKISVGGGSSVRSSFGFSLNSANNPTNACAIVLIYKNPDASTKIYSYGYNNCNSSDSRRVERGIEVQY